jgi:Ser/Thr protein kinase RdoA (MazF antagonist)
LLAGSFQLLSPGLALQSVDEGYGLELDGTLDAYPSYVNRVYGIRAEDGERYVVKFYRPGRWSREAVLDEHRFLLDCAEAEIPVIAPLPGRDGETLHAVTATSNAAEDGGRNATEDRGDAGRVRAERVPADGDTQTFLFALFPRTGGRNFEPENERDLERLGALLGRCHAVSTRREAPHRAVCAPAPLTASFVQELLGDGLVHPDSREEFGTVCTETLARISPLFDAAPRMRLHGDCHRGNIIDRPGSGLVLIDFDDMMSGPPVQDLWLVLPGYAADSQRELAFLLEGYEKFAPFDRDTLRLIEPLRFMRMIYFLAWRARQRDDYWFRESVPDWGTEAFWIKELEDLRQQAGVVHRSLED